MLINLRNALMAGKRLPYDAEVEYLESTGTQYINTGIVADSDTRIAIGMSLPQISAATISFGAAGMQINIARNFSRQYFGTTTEAFSHNDIVVDVRFDLDMDAPMKRVVLNGTAKTINWTTAWTCADAFPLFALVSGGQVMYRTCRVYSCKIWQNSVLVRDFIPVRKGTVGYLYDRVSGKLFGNAGTGDFVLGQDVVPVEYIGISGGAYIDTGVVASTASMQAGLDVEIVASFAVRSTSQATFKNRVPYFFVGTNGSNKFYSGLGQTYTNTNVANDGATHRLRISSTTGAFSIDGEVATQYQSPTYTGNSSGNILIGACSNDTDPPTYFASMRVAECSIRNSNALASHFRPVRVGTDATSWEGAMMDVLTRRIYRNAGTGAFTFGNDLKYPIPAS